MGTGDCGLVQLDLAGVFSPGSNSRIHVCSITSHQCDTVMVVYKEHNAKVNLYLSQEAFHARKFNQV